MKSSQMRLGGAREMNDFREKLLKRAMLFAFTVLFPAAGHAATYYVSTSGNDANSGLSESAPWKTLAKVNGKTFLPGDIILLKSGDVFSESLIFSSSGSDTSRIVLSSYGTGAKPEIRGYGALSGWNNPDSWTLYSAGVYRRAGDSSRIGRLWINGVEQKESQTTALTAESPWKGAVDGLYVKAPSNPATYFTSIEVGSKLYNVVYSEGKSNITIRGLKITGGTNSVLVRNARNIIIENNEIGFRSKGNGISHYSHTGGTTVNTIIRNNVINSGDSLYYTYYRNPHATNDAIYLGLGSVNVKIYGNYMWGWSHSGVEMVNLDSSYPYHDNEVYNNFITAPLIDYARGLAADYTSNGYANSIHHNTVRNTTVQNQFNGNGLKVYENIIDTVKGCPYPEKRGVGNGMTMDAYATPATNMEIYNNTITNSNYTGIRIYGNTGDVNAKTGINLHDNNLFNNGTTYPYQLIVFASPAIHHNTYVNNHFVNSSSATVVSYAGRTLTADGFNTTAVTNGDIITRNDSTLTYGGYATTVADLKIEYNESATPKTIPLSQPMIDSKGTKYASSVTLPPYSSMILMKDTAPQTTVAPSAPATVAATAGDARATVTFTAPVSNGGSAITGYTVTSIPAGGVDSNAGSTSLTHTVTGLTNGTAYTFTVKATNSAGTSVASAPSNSVVPRAAVASATTFAFSGPVSGNVNSASASFTVTPNGPYTGTITVSPTGTASAGLLPRVLTFSNSASPQSFTITPTVAGSLTLVPTNSGTLINPTSRVYTVNAVVPGAPTSVVAAAGNASASVTFLAPVDKGGETITGYTVTSNPAGGVDSNAGSTSLTHTMTGLTNGTAYTFTVKATNSAGTSLPSIPSNSVIPSLPADTTAPVISAFSIPSTSTSVVVSVTAFTATDNVAVTGYLLTESATPPLATAAGWSAAAPVAYSFSSTGTKTLYAWVKDAAGNVSVSRSATVSISKRKRRLGQ